MHFHLQVQVSEAVRIQQRVQQMGRVQLLQVELHGCGCLEREEKGGFHKRKTLCFRQTLVVLYSALGFPVYNKPLELHKFIEFLGMHCFANNLN